MSQEKEISKVTLARSLGVSRSSLYYKPKQAIKDSNLRDRIVDTLTEHPAYGYRRIALALGIGKNRAQRVMKKFGIEPKIKHRKPRYRKVNQTVVSLIAPRASNLLLQISSGQVILLNSLFMELKFTWQPSLIDLPGSDCSADWPSPH